MRPLRLTVVLPTFNRAASLRPAIDALLRQDADPLSYEILVVDNNSSDDTPELLASIADPRLRSVREERQGLACARNAGLAMAHGDLVAFIDDDVEAEPGWVSCILAALAEHPDVDGVGGQVLPDWGAPPPAWLTRRHWGPLALQDHGGVERIFDADCPIGLVGANVAFRRRVFERIGVFSPELQRVGDGIGSTEDHELLARLYDGGGRMLYLPGMRVFARVQPERCERAYHRRWHAGHGGFHARMRQPDMEGSRASVLGVPAHLFRSAAGDAARLIVHGVQGHWEQAFEAELRLRFFLGFVRTRVTGVRPGSDRGQTGVRPGSDQGQTGVRPGSQRGQSGLRPLSETEVPHARAQRDQAEVSVLIPCYNQAHFLTESIASVIPGERRVEIVVVDDGSADGTSETALSFPHVRCIRQPNAGLAAARNRALRESTGAFVIFLDADDRLLPGAIEAGMRAFLANPDCGMVFGRCVMMGVDGRPWPTPWQEPVVRDHHAALLRRNVIWMPAMAMFRREALESAGGFARGFDAAADYDLYLRVSRAWPIHDHAQLVAAYRRHAGNMSGNATRMLIETEAVMRRNRPGGDEHLLDAWREGRRQWREFYGTHLVEEIRTHVHAAEWRPAVRKALTLARRHPSLLFRESYRKGRTFSIAHP